MVFVSRRLVIQCLHLQQGNQAMAQPRVIGWVALIPLLLGAGPPVVQSSVPAPELDALFERADGWIGADGAYSVALSPSRTLWLFSDTWVGKIREGKRTDATIVNNTVGVQEGAGGRLSYSIARGTDGKAKALIVPADGRGWFWLQAGVADGGRLSLFLNQVEKTDAKSVFGFRAIGLWLGTVANAEQAPQSWRVEQVKMPNAVFAADRTLAWGAALLRVGDDLYVYGIDERRGKIFLDRQMVVARVPAAAVRDFAAWRYFREGKWGRIFITPAPSRAASPANTRLRLSGSATSRCTPNKACRPRSWAAWPTTLGGRGRNRRSCIPAPKWAATSSYSLTPRRPIPCFPRGLKWSSATSSIRSISGRWPGKQSCTGRDSSASRSPLPNELVLQRPSQRGRGC